MVSGDLPLAFERVRTHLAVAIAAEAKWTTLERREYYFETADRLRWFIRRLRAADAKELAEHPEWYRALKAIRQLPDQGRALRLCQILREIMPESG